MVEPLAAGSKVPATWSADGRQIIYVGFGVGRPGNRPPDLGVLTLEKGRATTRTLMKTPMWEDDAALSPDGRWLVYESNEAGGLTTEVFVRPYPDVERGRWPSPIRAASIRCGPATAGRCSIDRAAP